ncbi:MAG TPA: DUF6600 domain-containing protein, partial [Stellaceae bacterium]|nr:DUF6600 domain-containing protein [Stellaceae bacterium]
MDPGETPSETGALRRRRPASLYLTTALALLIGAMPPVPVLSQAALAQSNPQDPPERVGQLSLISGLASERQKNDDSWSQAQSNTPMLTGSAVWTQPGAKAEIEVGAARVWLDGDTEVDVVQLNDNQVQLNVPQGRVDVHVAGKQPGESYVVNTPAGSASLDTNGLYRIVAGDDQNPARMAAFDGQGSFATADANQAVDAGGEIIAEGDPVSLQQAPAELDEFDRWTEGREHALVDAAYTHFVPPGVTGAEELDQYGQWRNVPDYGNVWVPTDVPSGWAPYREGHWQWVAPWGWTWVDNAPWGFAPFHYGRWVQVGGWWAWAPGPVADRPVYAPALVSFVGDPDAVVVDAGGPSVGWVPLGPGEIYTPSWIGIGIGAGIAAGVSFAIFQRWNWGVPHDRLAPFNHGRFIRAETFNNFHNDVHINQRFVTVVNRNTFIDARPVQGGLLHVRPNAQIRTVASFHSAGAPTRPSQAGRFGPTGRPAQAPPHVVTRTPHLAAGLHTAPRPFSAAPHAQGPAVRSHAAPAVAAPFRAAPAQPHVQAPAAHVAPIQHPAPVRPQEHPQAVHPEVSPRAPEHIAPEHVAPARPQVEHREPAVHMPMARREPVRPQAVRPPEAHIQQPHVQQPHVQQPHVQAPHAQA